MQLKTWINPVGYISSQITSIARFLFIYSPVFCSADDSKYASIRFDQNAKKCVKHEGILVLFQKSNKYTLFYFKK